jgi:hypothetical protein
MPGNPDEVSDTAAMSEAPFHIACDRSLDRVSLIPGVGDWRMPPLRFDTDYDFCVRRFDLAGNHLYDEAILPADINTAAVRSIGSLLEGNAALAAIGLGAPASGPRPFERADPPFHSPLVFPADCPKAVWQIGSPSPVPPGLVELVHQREPTLVLFSDVFERASLAVSASGTLLPPSAPVETVFMHGVLDGIDGQRIPGIIRRHERYLQDGQLGIDRDGCLNYFGDPQVSKIRVQLTVNDEPAAWPGRMPNENGWIEKEAFSTWPYPRRVELSVVAGTRKREFLGLEDLGKLCRVESVNEGVEVRMPPGAAGFAAIVPVVGQSQPKPHDTGQRIRLTHVTNGAWVRPRWLELREVTPELGQTSHRLQGAFQADVATSGSFTLSACWNECWDESVDAGWEEAAVESIVLKAGKVCEVITSDRQPGYGYGTEAVVVVTVKPGVPAPTQPPILAPVVVAGQVKKVTVIDGGQDFNSDHHGLRIIRRPPLFRVAEAVVTRTAGGPLRPNEIQVTDEGGWYALPPYVVAFDVAGDGYGARLTARLNGRGGVACVCVEQGGQNWSNDVIIKFYTHQWSLPERPIDPASPTCVQLESPPVSGRDAPSPIWHPFSDPAGRSVDYFLTVKPRHSKYLLEVVDDAGPAPKDPATLARTPVPRVSPPFNLNVAATARPGAPRVARLLPAFHWVISDGNGAAADPADYFHSRETGQLTLARKSAVRVYLRRPWHQTGPELLGVVLVPVIANTTRTGGDLDPARQREEGPLTIPARRPRPRPVVGPTEGTRSFTVAPRGSPENTGTHPTPIDSQTARIFASHLALWFSGTDSLHARS